MITSNLANLPKKNMNEDLINFRECILTHQMSLGHIPGRRKKLEQQTIRAAR